jgi:glycosyltransferase involved in cell wall biosynthesis
MSYSISFLIPCYNVEKFLAKSVSSVLCQKDPRCDLKIVLVDDQSTDGTFKIAQQFQAENPTQVQAFQNEKNRGPAFSFNRCWENNQSEFAILLHSDNELIDGALSLFIDYIASENYQRGIVFGDIEYIDVSGNVTGSWTGKHLGDGHLSNRHLIENYIDKDGSRFRPLQCLIDRKSFEEIGPYSEDYFLEDWEFTIRYLCHADFHRINAPVIRFRDRPNSLGHQPEVYADSMMDVIEIHEKPLSEKSGIKPETIYSNTLCRIILMFIHRNKTKVALEKFRFYKKKYKKKIMSFDVAVFSLLAYAKFQLKRLLCLS